MQTSSHSPSPILLGIGFTGIILLGFDASPFGPAPMALGMALLLLGLPLLGIQNLKAMSHDPVVWLIGVLATWVILRGIADLISPVSSTLWFDPEGAWNHFRVSGALALMIGLWVAALPRAVGPAIAAMIGGMIAFQALHVPFEDILPNLAGNGRLRADTPSPNAFGLFSVTMIPTGILLIGAGIHKFHNHQRAVGANLQALGLALVLANLVFLLASQSRAAWVAGLVAIPLALAFVLWDLNRQKDISKRALAVVIGSCFLIIAGAVVLKWDLIVSRWGAESQTILAVLTLQTENVTQSSFGKRWLMWADGLRNIKENPLWGWGPGFVSATRSVATPEWIQGRGHYHNTYIHFSVSMGLLWTLLWVALQASLLWRGIRILLDRGLQEFGLAVGLAIVIPTLTIGLASYRFHNSATTGLFLFGSALVLGTVLRLSPYALPFRPSLRAAAHQP